MHITSIKSLLILGLVLISTLLFLNCHINSKEGGEEGRGKTAKHIMMHMASQEVNMDPDLPIFQPSKRTYNNYIKIDSVENVYLRQNTALKNKSAVIAFYKENLPKNGWSVNLERSTQEKFVLAKADRYATIRIFEMKQADSMTLAISINMLRPARARLQGRINDMRSNPDSKAAVLCK